MSYKIGLYIRVSTEEQALRTEGSLDSQMHRLTGYVDIKNMQQTNWGSIIEKYIDDGYSAKDTNRPALQRLLKDLRKGKINMILVTDLSRLSRSIRDFCGLLDLFKETKGQFLSLKEQFDTTTAAGEMMLFNMINLAQFERRQISERVSLNFHSRSMRGLRNGGSIPLGFKLDHQNKATLLVDNEEATYVKTIYDTYISEGSLYKAAAKLREMGIPSKSKSSRWSITSTTEWSSPMLLGTLRNFFYIGMREVNKRNKDTPKNELKSHEHYQLVKASWPTIIDETTFYVVQRMLDENSKNERTRRSSGETRFYLLSGLLTCTECGRSMVGAAGHGRDQVFRYYVHRPIEGKKPKCRIKTIRADELEETVVNHLARVVSEEGYFDNLEEKISEIQATGHTTLTSQKREAEKALSQTDLDIRGVIRLQTETEDRIALKLYGERLNELHLLRNEQKSQLAIVSNKLEECPNPIELRKNIETNIKRFHKAWPKTPTALRKKLIQTVFDKLLIESDGIHVFYFAEETAKPNKSTGENPVDLSIYRGKKKIEVASHNEKVAGFDIVRFGCGSRI